MVAHLAGDGDCARLRGRRDDTRGHDLAQLHGAYATRVSSRPANARRPARGGRRSRKPALPRLRRAALRLDRPAAGPDRPGQPLRELRPRRRRRARRAGGGAATSSTGSRTGSRLRIANRGGFSAWLGGAGWAGLEPGARYLFTVEAVRRLVARRDQVVKERPLGARSRDRDDVADDPQRLHLRARRRPRCLGARGGRPRRRSHGSAASTP